MEANTYEARGFGAMLREFRVRGFDSNRRCGLRKSSTLVVVEQIAKLRMDSPSVVDPNYS